MVTIVDLKCVVCGKSFQVKKGKEKKTCSSKCRKELRKIEDQKYYVIKDCQQCGKPFTSKKKYNQKFCSTKCMGIAKHENAIEERICIECGGKFNERKKHTRKLCSDKCRKKWNKRPENTKSRIDKSRDGMIKKYGVDHSMKIPSSVKKLSQSLKKTYAENKEEIFNKIKSTNLERHGDENYNNHTQISLTKKDKYGDENYNNRKKFHKTRNRHFEDKLALSGYTIIKYINNNYVKIKHPDGHTFECSRSLINTRFCEGGELSLELHPYKPSISNYELELSKFLKDNNIDHITSDKKILHKRELDIVIPSKKIAIEINGLYWHSELYKDSNYHLDKTIECNKKGYDLIHVFEDEWKYKKDIVKSIILNRVGYNKYKYFARKTKLKEISTKEAKDFLNKNHILGYAKSNIKLGLYDKDQLVSVMTFERARKSISDDGFVLNRYSNVLYSSIIGGADKLFKYFIKRSVKPTHHEVWVGCKRQR